MNKLLVTSAFATLSLIGFSGFNSKTAPTVGSYAPGLKIEHYLEGNASDLQSLSKGYTLLHFWDSRDANSRLNGKILDLTAKHSNLEKLNIVAVNLDDNVRMFEEIVKVDRLDGDYQYRPVGSIEKVRKDFRLTKGMKSFLIDPNGEIVAENPTQKDLQKLL